MSLETETTATTETPQTHQEDPQKDAETSEQPHQEIQVSAENTTQPLVQEDACILKSPKSPLAEATEDFLSNEKGAYEDEAPTSGESSEVPVVEPRTPTNSETSDEPAAAPQVVEVAVYSETVAVEEVPEETVAVEEVCVLNGHSVSEPEEEPSPVPAPRSEPQEKPMTNGQSNGVESSETNGHQVLNGTIASELVTEDYKLPDVVEVKKNFENVRAAEQNVAQTPQPKKGALSTNLDSQSVKQAYQDVRHDGSETQWAVFKFEGPTIITSAKGTDFNQFKSQFGDDERAFGYIRVQTGDEMSKRAKFLLVTWVGSSVSVLKRAKMSTDKALIKDVVSNFAVELQTENISDINLQNFETELDKASGAHYGTGIRS